MEIVKLNIQGYYFYCPELEIENFEKHYNKNSLLKDCAICKRSILEASYDTITNNKKIIEENEITIGKCGHMFHSECIDNWLKTSTTCPIDKVKWQLFRKADTYTKLSLKENDKIKENTENKENKTEKIVKQIKNKIKYNPYAA